METHTITRRRLFQAATGAALLAGAGTLGGCSSGGGGNQAQQDASLANRPASEKTASAARKITVGYNPNIAQAQALVGLVDFEYAKAEDLKGVTISQREFQAGPAVLEALRAGTIDVGCSGPFPALKAFAEEGDVVLLCGTVSGGTQLMVQDGGPIKAVADLKGKTVGVNQLGSTVETMVRANVLGAGLKNSDVKFVKVDPAEQAEALQSGDVAAVAAPAPWPSFVQVNAKARPLLDWKQIYNGGKYLAGSFFATKKWVEANPELARDFVRANEKITQGLNANRAAGDARVLAAWEKISKKTLDPKIAKAAFQTIQYTTEANEDAMQKFADINYEVGVLRKKPVLKGFVWK